MFGRSSVHEAPVVHRGDAPGKRRYDRVQVLGTWQGPHATLRFTYSLEFSPCAPCLKCFSREAQTIAQAGTTAKFQQLRQDAARGHASRSARSVVVE